MANDEDELTRRIRELIEGTSSASEDPVPAAPARPVVTDALKDRLVRYEQQVN